MCKSIKRIPNNKTERNFSSKRPIKHRLTKEYDGGRSSIRNSHLKCCFLLFIQAVSDFQTNKPQRRVPLQLRWGLFGDGRSSPDSSSSPSAQSGLLEVRVVLAAAEQSRKDLSLCSWVGSCDTHVRPQDSLLEQVSWLQFRLIPPRVSWPSELEHKKNLIQNRIQNSTHAGELSSSSPEFLKLCCLWSKTRFLQEQTGEKLSWSTKNQRREGRRSICRNVWSLSSLAVWNKPSDFRVNINSSAAQRYSRDHLTHRDWRKISSIWWKLEKCKDGGNTMSLFASFPSFLLIL